MELKREIDWLSVNHNHTHTTRANGMGNWWTVISNAVRVAATSSVKRRRETKRKTTTYNSERGRIAECIKRSDCHYVEKRGSFFRPQASSSAALFALSKTRKFRTKKDNSDRNQILLTFSLLNLPSFRASIIKSGHSRR